MPPKYEEKFKIYQSVNNYLLKNIPPGKKILAKYKLTKVEHIQYHIENYFIRVVSLINKIGILINEVYQIGLPPHLCQPRILYQIEF